ncbi:MAG: hypothetical protein WC055_02380 [Melioribacteraceae bacterium]
MKVMLSYKKIFISILGLFVTINVISVAQSKLNDNWAPRTKTAIDNLIEKNKNIENSYVVFDWDNTSIFSDVQEMTFVYQLENLAFKMTPQQFEYSFNHFADVNKKENLLIPDSNFPKPFFNNSDEEVNISKLSEDCLNDYKYFYENFRTINSKSKNNRSLDELKKSNEFSDFKAKMWFTYNALYKTFTANVAYTWVLYITATGFTKSELQNITLEAIDWGIKKEASKVFFDSPNHLNGSSGRISNLKAGNYFGNSIRPIKEIGELFSKLAKNNIDVFICTASMQDVVEVFATNPKYGYNLTPNRVIGMRLKTDPDGKYLSEYDFSNGYTINGSEGKTININNLLVSKYNSNPIMIAGDSDGDYSMLTQFSGVNDTKTINDLKPTPLLLIVNRLKDGKIGELCKIAANQFSGNQESVVRIVLQGRDENLGCWIPNEGTLKYGLVGVENIKVIP